MKAIKFMAVLFAASALSFTATSCGDEDDIEDIIEDMENGNYKATADLKKSSNELVLTIKYPGVYTEVTTAKFRDDKCVSYIMKMTYASDKLADAAWEEAKEESEDVDLGSIKRDGKTITWDLTEEMEGMSYDYALQIMQAQKDAVERGNDASAF